MLVLEANLNKEENQMAEGQATVAISREVYDQIVPIATKATGYKPQIKDFVEKAVIRELELLKKSAGRSAKNR
ncbi:hypothetical protein [Leptospira alexanderi]|uniref:hypothetical protein n=1 Tax=Leptospira alexanderi TaxID=100053 RepID=UPI001BAFA958|nr:hypothetical protein [Leptospira alexanderi]